VAPVARKMWGATPSRTRAATAAAPAVGVVRRVVCATLWPRPASTPHPRALVPLADRPPAAARGRPRRGRRCGRRAGTHPRAARVGETTPRVPCAGGCVHVRARLAACDRRCSASRRFRRGGCSAVLLKWSRTTMAVLGVVDSAFFCGTLLMSHQMMVFPATFCAEVSGGRWREPFTPL